MTEFSQREHKIRELADRYLKLSAGNSEPHATIQRGVFIDLRRALGDDVNAAYDEMLVRGDDVPAEVAAMEALREQIVVTERAVQDALNRAPLPFGQGDDGGKHLRNALDELRRARVYADSYVDVARQDAGLSR